MLAKWKSKVVFLHKACLQTCMCVSRHTYIIKNVIVFNKIQKKSCSFYCFWFVFDLCSWTGVTFSLIFCSLDERVCPKSTRKRRSWEVEIESPITVSTCDMWPSFLLNEIGDRFSNFKNVHPFSLTFFHQNLKFSNVSCIWLTFPWNSQMYHWFCMLLAPDIHTRLSRINTCARLCMYVSKHVCMSPSMYVCLRP